jgi:outer membrane receptor protein involved in Fe transport
MSYRPVVPLLVAPLALAMAAVTAVAAAAENAPLEVIIVTPVPGQGLERQRLAANLQTATAADLQRSHAADLASFMTRRLGSVHVNEIQNNPFQPDVNFRGFTASPLLGTAQGLSVYLDGVRLNQPFGDVVSWDLIPRSAIAALTLMPGSNPLFGLNTLGGALNVRTKDGRSDAGTTLQALGGQFGRRAVEFEHGGNRADGLHWFVTGNRFEETGWRVDSPSDVRQLYAKVGLAREEGGFNAAVAWADNDLYGNGLQESRLLGADYRSVYTKPDFTANRGVLFNVDGSWRLGAGWSVAGNGWQRRLDTATLNGDINEDALDQSLFQPTAAERTALAAAGYSGVPASGESTANTAFPRWRCIANVLLKDEPGEKCTGLLNTSDAGQDHAGFNLQFSHSGLLAGLGNQFVVGGGIDRSDVSFVQNTELGYLRDDRSVVGLGVLADGRSAGTVDGEPLDARVDLTADTRTFSVFVADTLSLDAVTDLTVSGRYNRTRVRSRDAITPGGGKGSLDGDHQFSRFNPALGLTRRFANGFVGYAGLNQGSRAPSAIELGCADPESPCKLPNAMAGDPPLAQVVATTAEVGLRQTDTLRWNVGIFRTDSRDDILFVADDTAGYGYFRNFGVTRRQGVEAGIGTEIGGFTLGANYSVVAATYQSEEVLGGEANSSNEAAEAGSPGLEGEIEVETGDRIPLVPRQMLKLFAEWPVTPALSLTADLLALEGVFARGNENNRHAPDGSYYLGSGRTGGFAVLNLGADWQPLRGLQLFLQVNNLFDRQYATAAQLGAVGITPANRFQARPFPANPDGERPLQHSTFLAPGAPRTVWAGLRYSF